MVTFRFFRIVNKQIYNKASLESVQKIKLEHVFYKIFATVNIEYLKKALV